MKHDIKKLITDYLDGLVGRKMKLYRYPVGINEYRFVMYDPSPDPYNKIVYEEIIGYNIDYGEDSILIIFYFPIDGEVKESYIFLDNEMPIFETID